MYHCLRLCASVDVVPGRYFLSVKCKDSGICGGGGGGGGARLRFRAAPLTIRRDVSLGDAQHGELCPLEWVHHRFQHNADDGDSGHRRSLQSDHKGIYNLKFIFWKFVGDFYGMVSDHPPFKLMAPYKYARLEDNQMVIEFCDVKAESEVWVGLYGGTTCAVYDMDVYVHMGECNAGHGGRRLMRSDSTDDDGPATTGSEPFDPGDAVKLVPGILTLGSCQANSFVDYYLPVKYRHTWLCNLITCAAFRSRLPMTKFRPLPLKTRRLSLHQQAATGALGRVLAQWTHHAPTSSSKLSWT